VHLIRGRPHPELTGLVGSYADFSQSAAGPVETREVATARIVLIVDLEDGCRADEVAERLHGATGARPPTSDPFVQDGANGPA
jgi:hypothetical protein